MPNGTKYVIKVALALKRLLKKKLARELGACLDSRNMVNNKGPLLQRHSISVMATLFGYGCSITSKWTFDMVATKKCSIAIFYSE
jgi:hypothetical protein